jgi:hypothetical protein
MGRLTPDLVSCNALIKANQVAARPEKAVELLQEMTRKVLTSLCVCVSCVCACVRACALCAVCRAFLSLSIL